MNIPPTVQHTRIVDQNVCISELGFDLVEKIRHGLAVRDVGCDREGLNVGV